MSPYIVWIDHDQAKAIPIPPRLPLDPVDPVVTHVRPSSIQANNLDREKRTLSLFRETARLLVEAEKVLIVGPGLAKHLFNNYLAEHFPRIFRKVAGCEALEQTSDFEMRNLGERFFRKQESPI